MASKSHASKRYRTGMAAVSVLVAIVAGLLIWRLQSTPQMGTSEEVFKTVDALFTSCSRRDTSGLEDCATRLSAARREGQLPASAADFLDSVIEQAREGKWEAASKRLYSFMYGQRRTASG